MRLAMPLTRTDTKPTGPTSVETYTTESSFALWQAMRHANSAISADQQACLARYDELKDDMEAALNRGECYPWTLLARLEPPKFMSDVVESLIGAIWIDSGGGMGEARMFLERLGVMPYARRALGTGVRLLHPKEELGETPFLFPCLCPHQSCCNAGRNLANPLPFLHHQGN